MFLGRLNRCLRAMRLLEYAVSSSDLAPVRALEQVLFNAVNVAARVSQTLT